MSGGRAGSSLVASGGNLLAGRHSDAHLRFSAEHDLAVSARHAEFWLSGGTWHVRDLSSRNGTWVNGSRIARPVALKAGDSVVFGSDGPTVVFEPDAEGTVPPMSLPESATRKLRAAIGREKMRLRLVAGGVIGVVLLVAAGLVLADTQERAAWEADRVDLQLRIDSLITSGRSADGSLEIEVAGLRAALGESEDHLRRLHAELGAARRGSNGTAIIAQELLSASTALQRQQHAASLDYQLIQRRNRGAVALVWVEYTDGSLVTGTAFSMRADGTMVTNRHITNGQRGDQLPRRIAVRFSDSEQAFPARLVGVSDSWDMAAIRVENILGQVPTVARMNTRADTLPQGAPLAVIGYPMGGALDLSTARNGVARPIISAGLLHVASQRALELEGVGTAGASGSPIMDSAGDVVGMLYGGRDEGGTHVLMAVPAYALLAFLAVIR
jgi:S1-C subfamily serine protease